MNRLSLTLPFLLLAGCSGSSAGPAGETPAPLPAPALSVVPLSGQPIPVLPVTFMVVAPPVDEQLPGAREARLAWADTVLAGVLQARAPEVSWVLPPELRKVAHRAPNMVHDPEMMGQAVMRSTSLEVIPDPLRSSLRALAALTNARMVFIPAALRLASDSSGAGVRAEASLVLVDTRNGRVVWRSNPVATGADAAAAVRAAFAHVLPDFD